MKILRAVSAGLGVLTLGLLASCASLGSVQDASALMEKSSRAMGAAELKSIRF